MRLWTLTVTKRRGRNGRRKREIGSLEPSGGAAGKDGTQKKEDEKGKEEKGSTREKPKLKFPRPD